MQDSVYGAVGSKQLSAVCWHTLQQADVVLLKLGSLILFVQAWHLVSSCHVSACCVLKQALLSVL